MRVAFAAMMLLVASACTAGTPGTPPVAPLELPHWQPHGNAGIVEQELEPTMVAASASEIMLAADAGDNVATRLYYSADGRMWTPTDAGQQGWAEIAGNGRDVYALWIEPRLRRLVVRPYMGAGRWGEPVGLRLPQEPDMLAGLRSEWAIVVRPDGVLVSFGDTIWTSRDGKSFESMTVAMPPSDLVGRRPGAADTALGTALRSRNTRHEEQLSAVGEWPADVFAGLPADSYVDFAVAQPNALFVAGTGVHRLREGDPGFVPGEDDMGDNEVETRFWFCATKSDPRLRPATVEGGRLPDLGVSAHSIPSAVVPFRGGFLMTGSSYSEVAGAMGAVWISDDGCRWRKDKVRDNGFHEIRALVGAAANGDVVVLAGIKRIDGVDGLVIWAG